MFDTNKYRKACAQTKLDAQKLEEMIAMTENTNSKKRLSRPMKTALIAAACVAALCITAFAAVPAVQQLFTTYTVTYRSSEGMKTAIAIPPMSLAEKDGRTILTVDEEEIDVTDAFAKEGKYSFQYEDATITVDSEGWVDIATEDDLSMSYGFNLYGKTPAKGDAPQDDGVDAAPAEEMELPNPNADEVQEQYTVLPAPDGGMNIYDGQGNLVDYDPPISKDAPAE